MTQTLLVVVLFMGAMALLPWLVRRLQQRHAAGGAGGIGGASRVLSAVAVGPHQRVVTVEVGPEHARTVLVLGVTAQQVNCLHVLPAAGHANAPVSIAASAGGSSAGGTFHQKMAAAVQSAGKAGHG